MTQQPTYMGSQVLLLPQSVGVMKGNRMVHNALNYTYYYIAQRLPHFILNQPLIWEHNPQNQLRLRWTNNQPTWGHNFYYYHKR